jgi:hypothetical protein
VGGGDRDPNIGALQSEEYKQTADLGLLQAAIDRFIQSLRCAGREHPLRKLLILGLQGMLSEPTLKVPDLMKTADRFLGTASEAGHVVYL